VADTQSQPIRVLLIEDNRYDAELLAGNLADAAPGEFQLVNAFALQEGLAKLAAGDIHIVLLDLSLPDSQGLATFTRVQTQAGHLPVIVLTGLDDEELAVKTVQAGAQDYLVKGQTEGRWLVRAMRYARQRKHTEEQLRQLNADMARSQVELLAVHDDLKRAHEVLQATQMQLIQAEKMESIGRLAAGVAHEVKNPLAIALMGVEYLNQSVSSADPAIADVLRDMAAAIGRADTIIRGLVDFAAASELSLKEGDINEVVGQALLLVRHAFQKHHVVVHRQFGVNLPLVAMDQAKLEQVFINLFMNAIDAMDGHGTLTVTTAAMDSVVTVGVEDTGPGIPAEKLGRVFEPFFTTKPAGKGTGLGLAVAANIVEMHGGKIVATNRPEGGLQMTITLPALPPLTGTV
jgi:signal transduction histidine kinase